MSKELANFYRIYQTCPAKFEKVQMFVYFISKTDEFCLSIHVKNYELLRTFMKNAPN